QLVCVETVLTDEKKVWDNVKEAKLKSPDYEGMTPEEAMDVSDPRTSRPAGAFFFYGLPPR
ncbi:unnamed protein product, partial [Scytosiphon promiscuus]